MCCLYGLLDYKHKLNIRQKNHLLRKLSVACEKRGTDATGIAYNRNGQMEIHKRPLPAHSFCWNIPYGTNVVMGHTRLTTQGNEKINSNNHPFPGRCANETFALAHNGVLYNDKKLRREFDLPITDIETDSYVAVQLIEKTGTFDLKAIQAMAEKVEGSFCFTLLDQHDNLYLVKGNNPLTVYHFERLGIYVYASTEEILKAGLKKAGYIHHPHKKVEINQGDILILRADGHIEKESFNTENLDCYESFWFDSSFAWGIPYNSYGQRRAFNRSVLRKNMHDSYLKSLIDYAGNIGVTEEEIMFLYENGFDEEDIEELLYSPEILQECIEEMTKIIYA